MGNFAQKRDPQRPSTNSRADETRQVDWLQGERRTARGEVNRSYLFGLPTLRRAIRYAISLADLEPKQVYEPLGMDKATWSRIENGQQEFPAGKLGRLRLVLGNDAVHLWIAHEAGQELKPLKSELEAQLEQERLEKAELRKENDLLRELLRR